MSERDERAADDVIEAALMVASGGLNHERAAEAIAFGIEALRRQNQALAKVRYRTRRLRLETCPCSPTCKVRHEVEIRMPDPSEIARAASHTAKVLDSTFRLVEFAKGQPDSRPDTGTAWLKLLKDDQLDQVQRWVAENERARR